MRRIEAFLRSTRRALPGLLILNFIASAPPARAVEDLAGKTLYQLSGWAVPGLPDLPLKNFQPGKNYLSGEIRVANIDWNIVIFKNPGQAKANLALSYDQALRLSTLAPGLANSPLDALQLNTPTFVYSPPENAGQTAALPAPLASRLGTATLNLPQGLVLGARVAPTGELASLLNASGVATGQALNLSGKIDPQIFSGQALTEIFWQNLKLDIALGPLAPGWKPAFLTLGNGRLALNGVSTPRGWVPTAAVVADTRIQFAPGRELSFPGSRFEWLPDSSLAISSPAVAPSAELFALPSGMAIEELAMASTVAAHGGSFALQGSLSVNKAKESISLQLSEDGGKTDYLISLSGQSSLSQLAGWTVPGIGDTVVTELVIGNEFTAGNLSIGKQPWTVAVFKGPRQAKASLALRYDRALRLSGLMPAVAGSPLDALQLDRPAFVLAASENAGQLVELPNALARQLGTAKLTLPDGLQLQANASAVGPLADLLGAVGVDRLSGLPLSGSIDLSVLGGKGAATQVGQAFLSKLDLRIPFGKLNIPGLPPFVAITPRALVLRGTPDGKGISAGIATEVDVRLPQQLLKFDSEIQLATHEGEKFLRFVGRYVGGDWRDALGLPGLTLRAVSLDLALGSAKKISIAGLTDLGRIKNLNADVVLSIVNGEIAEAGIELLGADIPFASLPGISGIPNADHFAVRDLYLTTAAVGGTFKTSEPALKVLNGLSGALFKTGTSWNLALLKNDFALTDVLTLPPLVQPVLKPLKLRRAAFVLSQSPADLHLEQLPSAARRLFQTIYGKDSGHLKLNGGLQVVSAIDLGNAGRALAAIAPTDGTPVFSGGIGGLDGGAPTLSLEAEIPTLQVPKALSFIQLPEKFTPYLYINLTQGSAAIGAGMDVESLVHAKPQPIVFRNRIRFEAETSGGFAMAVEGQTDSAWHNALGINGLIFDPGTRLELKGEATGDVTVTFVGLTHMGSKAVELIGSASVNVVAGVIDKGAFEGKIDSISLNDILALTNGVVGAVSGAPLQPDFPNATLRGADVAFASPGVDIPEMQLVNGGIRIAGDLWVLFNDRPLGRAFAQIDGNGIILDGALHDMTLGPVALKNNKLDAKALVFPPDAHFKLNGHGSILGNSAEMEVLLGLQHMGLHADLRAGELLDFDFRAGADILPAGFTAASLAQSDLSLSSYLKADLSAWLRTSGLQAVQKDLGAMARDLKRLDDDLATAEAAVKTLDQKIADARQRVGKTKGSQDAHIKSAQQTADHFASLAATYGKDVSDAKSHIHSCSYTSSVCTWRNPFNGKCTKRASVPDLARNARCASDNIKWEAVIAERETLEASAVASKSAADELLSDIRKGLKSIPVDADPQVASLLAEREGAMLALKGARAAVDEAKGAAEAVEQALKIASQPGAFRLKEALVQGSLKKAILGTPAVIGVSFEALGESYYNGFAFSLTDPVFNADQFEALALFMVARAADSSSTTPPMIKQYLHDAYAKKHDEVDSKLQSALAANGLD